tara:strand:+ start:1398 stop:1973 length:576 start_codon:yes stop_codon:yes gene_type:complete
MKLTKIFLLLLIIVVHPAQAHGLVEEITCMLVAGTLDYRKPVKGPAVFEKVEENILSQQRKTLVDSGRVNLKSKPNSDFPGLSADINIAFLDANHMVMGASLTVNNKLMQKNQSQTQYFSKTPDDHFRILNYLCNNTSDQLISNGLIRRSYTCVVVQSLKAHGFFKDTKKLESYINGLKIKSIAPDLFPTP